VFPIGRILTTLIDLLIAATLLAVMMVVFKWRVGWSILLAPVFLCVQAMFSLGIVFFLSATNLFYRDVQHLVNLLLMLWMYACPIIYPLKAIADRWPDVLPFYLMNPLAVLIEVQRAALLNRPLFDGLQQYVNVGQVVASAVVVSVTTLVLGYAYFKKCEFRFAEVV